MRGKQMSEIGVYLGHLSVVNMDLAGKRDHV